MKSEVLIVDDDEAVLQTVKKILTRDGFDVLTAGGGKECLKIMRKGFKGLILMDVVMPDMDGWDTIQAMVEEKLTDGVLISMLTGDETPSPKMDQWKEYVLDYLTKPFDARDLSKIVKNYFSYLS